MSVSMERFYLISVLRLVTLNAALLLNGAKQKLYACLDIRGITVDYKLRQDERVIRCWYKTCSLLQQTELTKTKDVWVSISVIVHISLNILPPVKNQF